MSESLDACLHRGEEDDLNPFGEEEEDYDEGGEDTPIEEV